MRRTAKSFALFLSMTLAPAWAQQPQFEPLPPLDPESADKELAEEMFGRWLISDASGDRVCGVAFGRDPTIGGMEIEVDPQCGQLFPVMGDVTAWRLLEGWVIDLVDAERKTRVRFETPDESYVAVPEVDGIVTIEPEPIG